MSNGKKQSAGLESLLDEAKISDSSREEIHRLIYGKRFEWVRFLRPLYMYLPHQSPVWIPDS
jgi:hypothetical protein